MQGPRVPCASAAAAVVTAAAVATVATVATVAVIWVVALQGRPPAGDNLEAAARLAASAAAATESEVISFPSPPRGPSIGRFDTLPALQCRLHPTTSGGTSPDPNAVHNPYGRGGTGWVMQANASADPVIIPYAAGTCMSPLNDEFQIACMAAPEEMTKLWAPSARSGDAFMGGDPSGEFSWKGHIFYRRMSSRALTEPVVDGHKRSEFFRPHPCASAHRRTGLVCEEEIVAMLSLRRNSWVGDVQRQRGLYDVLSVGRAWTGIVLDKNGRVVAATDRVSNVAGNGDFDIVLYRGQDGQRRPVLAGDAAMLSLGRGVIADPSWLGGSFPSALSARVELYARSDGTTHLATAWSLSHGTKTTNSSRWLQEIARTMCESPQTSFVEDRSFCDGVDSPRSPRESPFLAGKHPVAGSVSFLDGQYSGWPERSVQWEINRPSSSEIAPPCNSSDLSALALKRPMWLLGRGDRELFVTGSAGVSEELHLARNLSMCKYNGARWDLSGHRHYFDGRVLTAHLSQRYRRDIFGVSPPEDPISNTDLLLALVVVVPEAIAVVLLLLRRHNRNTRSFRRTWREWSSLLVIVVAGAVALLGVGYLDRQEHLGHAWRAAAVRHSRRITANATEDRLEGSRNIDYRGRVVTDNERLIIIARSGYRPRLTRLLLLVSIVTYAALTAVLLLRWALATWRRRSDPDHDVEHGAMHATPPARHRRVPWRSRKAAHTAAEEDMRVDDFGREDGCNGGGD